MNARAAQKETPYEGRGRQNGRNGNNNNADANDGEPMDVMGDMRDSPVVVMMFLMGVASWFLRERCMC